MKQSKNSKKQLIDLSNFQLKNDLYILRFGNDNEYWSFSFCLSHNLYCCKDESVDKFSSKHNIGYLMRNNECLFELSIRENFKICSVATDATISDQMIVKLLNEVNFDCDSLPNFLDESCLSLDRINLIKLGLALLLLKKPTIIFIDAIFQDFDSIECDQLLAILQKLSETQTIIIIDKKTNNHIFNNVKIIDFRSSFIVISNDKNIKINDDFSINKNRSFVKSALKVINRIISGCKMKSILSSLFLSFVVAILAFFIIYKWTNYDTTLLDLCYSNDINYVMLSSRRMTYYDHGGFDDSAIDFSEEQLKTIGEYCEQDYLFISQSTDFYKNSIDDEYEFMSNASALIDSIGYNTFELVLNTSSNLDLKRDPRISFDINMRLPSSDNEIALTWLQADFLMKYGLISHGNHVFLDSLDDLIGLEINHKKITGIYSTEDEDFFSKHVSFSDSHDKYSAHFNHTFALARSIITFKKIDSGANILVRLSGDKHKDTNFIKSLDKRVFGIGDYVSLSTPFDAFPLSQNIFSIESPGYGYFLGISWTVLLLISYFIKRNTMRLYTPSLFYRYRYLKSYGFSKPKAEIFVWFVMLVRIIFEFLSSLVFIGLTCFVFNRLSYYSFLSLGVLSSVLVLFILVFIEEFIYFRQYRK